VIILHPFYRSRPKIWSPQLWELDGRIAVSRARRFCYVRIPKSANTAVASTLYYHEHGAMLGGRQAKRALRRPSLIPGLSPEALDGFFCFTFVRNPYHRILSAYLSKLVARRDQPRYRDIGERIARRHGELFFRTFCAELDEEGPYGNPHWYPQTSFVDAFGPERLDFVGRVERMREDLAHVVRTIFGRDDGNTYVREEKTGASSKLGEHYDAATRAIVARVYRDDFERFGYDLAV
jgi:hypothetical protein